MADPFTDPKDAARALLTHPDAKLTQRSGQFCGGMMFAENTPTPKQSRWLADLLRKHDLPPLATEDGDER